jgi:predicted dehydrogenase
MSSSSPSSRRRFLKQSALTLGSTLGFPAIVKSASPSSVIRLGIIGVGGRGKSNTTALLQDPNVVLTALCDVDSIPLDATAAAHPKARVFRDFRKLYDEALNDVDALVVSTTEHTHAYAVLPALRAKKPVYCEKPLSHNVAEARLMTRVAAEAGVATQMGTQIHSGANYRRVVELIQSGAIGAVTEAHVCVSRAWGLQSEADAQANGDKVHVTERPTEAQPVPPNLDWDLWIGPAPFRPFHEVYYPGPKWYRWWEFGNGTMSDLGSHWNDLPFWALKLDAPVSIEASGPEPHPEIAPATMSAVYEYAARGDLPPCKIHWHQGATKPEVWTRDPIISKWSSGVLFIGEKGMLLSDYSKHLLLPEAQFADFTPPAPFIPDSPGHQQEWLDAIRSGSATGSPFSYAGPLTEANHLGNVAFRAGKKLLWDSQAMRFPNAPEAERFLSRVPRSGWSLD